jgi:hypothetical protein
VRSLAVLLLLCAPAWAGGKGEPQPPKPKPKHPCLAALDALQVPYRPAGPQKGIEIPVEVTGPIGGVTYATWKDRALILDCSLVYSLALAAAYFTDAGIDRVMYSSSYQRRNIRGTNRPSKHSYGLAIDLHRFQGPRIDEMTIEDDFEQGLGDDVDCMGAPLTAEGAALRLLWCRMDRSGHFRIILNPDTDEDHYDHFHVEALPWKERKDVP